MEMPRFNADLHRGIISRITAKFFWAGFLCAGISLATQAQITYAMEPGPLGRLWQACQRALRRSNSIEPKVLKSPRSDEIKILLSTEPEVSESPRRDDAVLGKLGSGLVYGLWWKIPRHDKAILFILRELIRTTTANESHYIDTVLKLLPLLNHLGQSPELIFSRDQVAPTGDLVKSDAPSVANLYLQGWDRNHLLLGVETFDPTGRNDEKAIRELPVPAFTAARRKLESLEYFPIAADLPTRPEVASRIFFENGKSGVFVSPSNDDTADGESQAKTLQAFEYEAALSAFFDRLIENGEGLARSPDLAQHLARQVIHQLERGKWEVSPTEPQGFLRSHRVVLELAGKIRVTIQTSWRRYVDTEGKVRTEVRPDPGFNRITVSSMPARTASQEQIDQVFRDLQSALLEARRVGNQ